jgi:predicted nucleic acid-binding protein
LDGIYIDTNFLIDAVTGRDEEKSIQQSELERIMNSSMQVHIPQIILGESFAIIARKSNSNNLNDNLSVLVEWIQRLVPEADMSTCMPSINLEVVQMAKEVILLYLQVPQKLFSVLFLQEQVSKTTVAYTNKMYLAF